MLKDSPSCAKFIVDPGKAPRTTVILFVEERVTRGTLLPTKQNCPDISQWSFLSSPRFLNGG